MYKLELCVDWTNHDFDPLKYTITDDLNLTNIKLPYKTVIFGGSNIYNKYDSDKYNIFKDYCKIYMIPEEPNMFITHAANSIFSSPQCIETHCDVILTYCFFMNDWRKWQLNNLKIANRIPMFLPMNINNLAIAMNVNHDNIKLITDDFYLISKDNNIIYVGCFPYPTPPFFEDIRSTIKKYNGIIVAANPNIGYLDKLNLLCRSKITICHNLLFLDWCYPTCVDSIKTFSHIDKTAMFNHLDDLIIPQMKGRVFEAAFCKSLILCKRDPWNVIENWFNPNTDFIYFDNIDDLHLKIDNILNNYDYYIDHHIKNAYNRAINNYTTYHFMKNYIYNFSYNKYMATS